MGTWIAQKLGDDSGDSRDIGTASRRLLVGKADRIVVSADILDRRRSCPGRVPD